MPSLSLLLHAHPALGFWTALWAAGLLLLLVARRPLDGRAVALWALGALSVVSLVPPRGGPVPGLARTCDLRPDHLLWPTEWVRQDPRAGAVALLLLVGVAVAARARWVAVAAAVPVLVEVVQYAVPSLARACSVPDVVPALTALAIGAAVGICVRAAGRRLLRGRGARRAAALAVGAVVVTTLGAWTLRTDPVVDPHARVALEGEAFHVPGRDAPAGADALAWPESGGVPGEGTPYEDMSRTALRDLRLLTAGVDGGPGLPYAGPSNNWDYFWPRDGAFVAVALARTGQAEQAAELLALAGDLYLDPMYGFDARYLRDGDRVSHDPRRAQVDGCGWVLWAVHETGRSRAADVAARVDDLRDRCTDQLLRATGGGSHLPAPGQDYWEQTTFDHLLGASAPVAAGLRLAAADYRSLGQHVRAEQVAAAAAGVRAEVDRVFGPGFLRAGTHGGVDAATAMLMPPFDPDPLPGVRAAWLDYQVSALRPGGGLAPGSAWKQDGISWTPEVALVAYTAAASGETQIAHRWLRWLDEHRAPWGSLPEKVDSQGRPGGPAPLGWTSALVVLTLEALEDDDARTDEDRKAEP
ncbi:hypothetical protein [Ornithinimicrobium pekingense]|uniref:Glycoside hydrolase family 15 n=1 Tax=Ornithinimicrobium pekingense TaxID=384677 RepID=A0ABQ2F7G4_9MICO|nr:hypothetical protein [Ornithinimicrobium pekingense]GGK69488.1 hypothetical protein GCM10011509_17340 [Ornithinimicrobium pekingense]